MAVQASFKQGHSHFHGRGKQCMAIAATAVKQLSKADPAKWDSCTLDFILDEGDRLYIELSRKVNNDFWSVDDI